MLAVMEKTEQLAISDADQRTLQQADDCGVVEGVINDTQIGEDVLDLLAVEEPVAGPGHVWDARLTQLLLEGDRWSSHPRQDRDVRPPFPGLVDFQDLAGDELRLILRRVCSVEADRFLVAGAVVSHKRRLVRELRILADDMEGGVEHRLW